MSSTVTSAATTATIPGIPTTTTKATGSTSRPSFTTGVMSSTATSAATSAPSSGNFSSDCTTATFGQCESMAPNTSVVVGNWTATDVDNFCRNASVYSGCIKTINCSGVQDNALIVDMMTASRHADLYQYVCSSNVTEDFFDTLPCAQPIIERYLFSCYNSSFATPLNGSRISDICRYYNLWYWCLYDLVEAECGQLTASLHVVYSIKLWEPPVTAFYCSIVNVSALAAPPEMTTSTTLTPPTSTVAPVVDYDDSDIGRTNYETVVCEGTSFQLKCPEGYGVLVTSAMWGRDDARTCSRGTDPSYLNDVVSFNNVTDTLRQLCENRSSCDVTADVTTFGDVRAGRPYPPLYLVANYLCKNNVYTATQCEGSASQMMLSCPGNRRLLIRSAVFGRQDWNTTCPDETATPSDNCASPQASVVVQTLCNGRAKCSIKASTSLFSDPCPGSSKYLQVEYTCEECVNAYGDDMLCTYWAITGECVTNTIFMTKYCQKACSRCDADAVECRNLASLESLCSMWSSAGLCDTQYAFMYSHCRRSCLNCDGDTVCENKHRPDTTECDAMQDGSQCSRNPGWMLANCTRTCFSCDDDIVRCENVYNDTNECERRALQGECSTDPGFMIAQCSKTCLGCGQEDPVCMNEAGDDDCKMYAGRGDCVNNAVWMFRNCWKSCVQCQGQTDCINAPGTDDRCEALARLGRCDTDITLLDTCRLSCTRCAPIPPTVSECVNVDSDEDCEMKANDTQCLTNPRYMLTYCRRTCTLCDQQPVMVGGKVVPGTSDGVTADLTSWSAIVLPDEFLRRGKLLYFSAIFVSTTPVYLQIWRPGNTSDQLMLVYNKKVFPQTLNEIETISIAGCVEVLRSDRVGFTTFEGPTPVATRFEASLYSRLTSVRIAPASESFNAMTLPYDFSVAAAYLPHTSCQ